MKCIDQVITGNYAVYNGDNMEIIPSLKSESIGVSIYSPAFPEIYAYSNDPRDMSNCTTYDEGIEQYRYVVREVHRLLKPGRITAVHCMDLKDGTMYQKDFPGDIVRVHKEAGFHFFCRVTIWKDPWLVARRTRMKSLMHKTITLDSSKSRVAGADYILAFRKGGENPEPIRHPHGLKTYAGERQVPEDLVARFTNYTGDQRKNLLSHWIWRAYASPVWMDIRANRLLPCKNAKESEEEQHVCRLQLDVIERCLTLWSNPGDVLLSPFAGVGSEVYAAVMNSRKGIGIELKSTYYRQMVANLRASSNGTMEMGALPFGEHEEDEDKEDDDEEGPEDRDDPSIPFSRAASDS